MTLEEYAYISEKKRRSSHGKEKYSSMDSCTLAVRTNLTIRTATQKHSEFQYIMKKISSVIGLNTVKNKRVDYPFSMHPVALKTHLHSNYFRGK
jgi:hypothetical protein